VTDITGIYSDEEYIFSDFTLEKLANDIIIGHEFKKKHSRESLENEHNHKP